jgi:hypothetical protein
MVDAEEVTDQEELRFAKKQQWYVATASVTLNAATFALLKGSHLHDYEALAAIFFILFVAAAGVGVLWHLQDHMQGLRRKSEPDAPWYGPTDVVVLLTFVVVAVAVGVGYCILYQIPMIRTRAPIGAIRWT